MKKLISLGLLALSLVMGGCASTEHTLTNMAFSLERARADLDVKNVQVGEFNVPYLEGGEGDTVFLIHGFQSNKDIWVRMAGQLTDQYHVIAIDLPAHGDSNILMDKSYTIPEQAKRVVAIMDQMKLTTPVNLVGHSMGGAIAFELAATAPTRVKTLALISSAGVVAPHTSELLRQLQQGKNPLIVRNKEDYEAMLAFTMSDAPYIPGPMISELTREAIAREPIAEKIFADLDPKFSPKPEETLARITAPVLVLWGDEDKVVDVSSTEVFKKWLPKSEVVILKGVGHAPQMEHTKETAQAYKAFLARNKAL